MSNQSEHVVEVDHEVKYESIIEEDYLKSIRKYFAISQEGDFLVEFKEIKLNSPNSLEFELKMYNINNFKNEDGLIFEKDSKPKNAQIDLIKNVPKPILRWSVAVSDKSTNSSKFKLLAISCINAKDMEYFKEYYKKISSKKIQNIQNNGFIFVFIINKDYSINNTEDKKLLIKYSGIVKLFYEDADDYFLILLTLSGIYKHHIKNKCTYSIQELKGKFYVNQPFWIFLIITLSNNGKLLAYFLFKIKEITLYSIKCGLEIAELTNILDTNIFKTLDALDRIFLYFFQNDDKLLIYYLEMEFLLAFPKFRDSEIEYVGKSNSCIVIYQRNNNYDKLFIYNDMIVDRYFNLKESDRQNWIIRDLEALDKKSELKLDKLDKLYEPYHSEKDSWKPKKIEVIGIKCFIEKFKFNIKVKDAKGIKQIKMDDEYDINVAKNAYIHFDLISILVKAREHELLNYILFFGEPVHIPQNFPWSGKKNTISTVIYTALSEKDNTMLACFLEYYSNNAINNIGWMNTVVDIIPELFKSNKENGIKEQENYKFYGQKLFYSSCFCDKEFDLFSFEILEVFPKSNGLLKVCIPITQLIPQKSKLVLQEIERYLSPGAVDYSPFIKIIETGERDIFYENPSMGAAINWMWYSSKFYWPKLSCISVLYFLTYSIIFWAYIAHIEITESEEEFNEVKLCFTSNIDVNIFEEGGNSMDSEVETDLTNSEEYLYPLTKGQRFALSLVKSELHKSDGIPRHVVSTVLKGIAMNFTIIALSISNFITLGTTLETVVNNESMLQLIAQ
ncbi:3160_t:CDS:10, partial [Gigaspora margarita]